MADMLLKDNTLVKLGDWIAVNDGENTYQLYHVCEQDATYFRMSIHNSGGRFIKSYRFEIDSPINYFEQCARITEDEALEWMLKYG